MTRKSPPPPADAPAEQQAISFEEAFGRLEEIVRQLEEGTLGLSDALARYEEGMHCLKQCHQALEQTQRRIELLTSVDADGQATTAPFEEETMTLEEKAASRSRRRSKSDAEDPGTQGGRLF